jgi:histidinol dehydrogenase
MLLSAAAGEFSAARRAPARRRVVEIFTVQRHGDGALLRYTKRFDRVVMTQSTMEVSRDEIKAAVARVSAKDLQILRFAAKRIAAFHRRQLQKSWQYRDPLGMLLGQRITPLERVGVYVPGGKASYPSTVLMNVIPAKVAGVKEIIMTSPIGRDGAIILAAAHVAGVDRIFRVGGAQRLQRSLSAPKPFPRWRSLFEHILSRQQGWCSARESRLIATQ